MSFLSSQMIKYVSALIQQQYLIKDIDQFL